MNNIAQKTKITTTQINSLITECNGKLNLSGGVMTGIISRAGVLAKATTDSTEMAILGGTEFSKGSGIHFYGKDYSGDNKGKVILWSCDSTGNRKYLQFRPDGVLNVNGTDLVTTSFGGSTTSSNGTKGMVPPPSAGQNGCFLRGDAVWSVPSKLGENYISSGQDFNSITTTGVYRFNQNHPNMPVGYDWGQLFVGHGGGDTIFQIVVGYHSETVYPAIRCGNPQECGGVGAWTNWYKGALMNMNNRLEFPNGTQFWIE